ncbi:MAG: ABC transporter ATP-binding protein [Acidobacteriota bacterium]
MSIAQNPDPAGGDASVIAVESLQFSYGREQPTVLDIEEFTLGKGERVFVYGPSGCGKTTLLGVLAGVLEADSGAVRILGEDLTLLSAARRDAFRADHIGYIFQMFNLLPYLSVLDNILLPVTMSKARRSRLEGTAKSDARALAEQLDLTSRLEALGGELSVGQQQRVAAARALIGSPELIIADEPTSALDTDRRTAFLELLFEQCKAVGASLLFVSHDRTLEGMFDRVLELPDINRARVSE